MKFTDAVIRLINAKALELEASARSLDRDDSSKEHKTPAIGFEQPEHDGSFEGEAWRGTQR